MSDYAARLDGVVQLAQALGQNFSEKVLTDLYAYILEDLFQVPIFCLSYHNGHQWCKIGRGVSCPETDLSSHPAVADFQPVNLEPYTHMLTIRHHNLMLARLLYQIPSTEYSVSHLQGVTNMLVVGIYSREMLKQQEERRILNRELELASQIQQVMVTPTLPHSAEFSAALHMKPRSILTGDYADILPLREGEWLFLLGDVSGKGLPAALLRANLQAHLHALVPVAHDLEALVRELNARFFKATNGDRFVTLFIATLSVKTGCLRYINAGTVPPMLQTTKGVEELSGGTTLLGCFEELPFVHPQECYLKPPVRFCLYSDGLSEATNLEGQMIQVADWLPLLDPNFNVEQAEAFNDKILKELMKLTLSDRHEDDLSILTVQWNR